MTENEVASFFNATKIRAVVIYGGDGDDHISIEEGTARLAATALDPLAGTESTPFDYEIHGQGGDDRLEGGSGNDTLYGDIGNDSLSGGGGDDAIFGENGKDTIDGGTGDDLMSGGRGVDKVVYNSQFDPIVISNDGIKNDVTYSPRGGADAAGAQHRQYSR